MEIFLKFFEFYFLVNILESLEPDFKQYKIAYECVGGGRILHKPDEKTIRVYGFSQGFGQADHSKTCELLRKHYSDYKVDWSNEGYWIKDNVLPSKEFLNHQFIVII